MPPSRSHKPPPKAEEAPIGINGWKIYTHPLFLDQFETLLDEVDQLRIKHPKDFTKKKKTKLLAAIVTMAFEIIPCDPAARKFLQGTTLGDAYKHWHRGKFFEGRFRLFFRYSSKAKIIVLAWVNDSETLRTYGSKSDAYAVFQSMLAKGNPPDSWDELLTESLKVIERQKKLFARGKK